MNFFPENLTLNNFPNKNDLTNNINNYLINELINKIKNEIISGLTNNPNIKYITFHNCNLVNYNNDIINNVKTHLLRLNYTISDVDDTNNNNIGWKLHFK